MRRQIPSSRRIIATVAFLSLCGAAALSSGCTEKVAGDCAFPIGPDSFKDARITGVIGEYLTADTLSENTGGRKLYRLLLEQDASGTVMTISSVIHYDQVFRHFYPVSYMEISGRPLVVCTRWNTLYAMTPAYRERYRRVLETRMDGAFFEAGSTTYDCPVWRVSVRNDSVRVLKNVLHPDMPYKKSDLEFLENN